MSMSVRNSLAVVSLAFAFCMFATVAVADPQPATEGTAAEAQTNAVTAEETIELIRQLNDDKFAVRQAATQKLVEAGPAAIPAIVKAAQGEELEVTTRALSILEEHLTKGEADVRQSARAALEQLAASDNENAAGRAAKLLQDSEAKPNEGDGVQLLPGGGIQIVPGGGGIQIGGGQIQIQVQAGGAGARKFQMKNVNGLKEIEVEEDGKKVTIVDDPNKGITLEVTKKTDGKEETKKYEAKNEAELKKNHPEAHKMYKKYTTNNGIIQMQAIPLQLGRPLRQRIQIGPNGIKVVPDKKEDNKEKAEDAKDEDATENNDGEDDDEQVGALDDARRQIQELAKQLEQQAGKDAAKHLKQALEQLEQMEQQLKQLEEANGDQ